VTNEQKTVQAMVRIVTLACLYLAVITLMAAAYLPTAS